MIHRRQFGRGLALSLLAAPRRVAAQPATTPPVVGILYPGVSAASIPGIVALREGLRDLGYVEGRSIVLEYRWAAGQVETLPALATDLVRRNVDILYALGPQAIRAAMAASRGIAIVGLDLEGDPVKNGFIASFARPGANMTGLFLDLPGLTGKWLQLIREAAPATRRVAVLWDATTGPHQIEALRVAAAAAAAELRVFDVRTPAEYEKTLSAAMGGRPQALVQLSSPLAFQASPRVAEFALKNRLPGISMYRLFAETGGLMAYGPDLLPFMRRATVLIDKILKGAKPGDLPAEQPSKYELIFNSKTAQALGLTIPPSLLLRADHVIE